MLDWDLLRFFMALSRCGSMTAAARQLRVDQTTVGRRIAALEEQLGAQLFRRTASGHEPTQAAQDILATVARAEGAISDVERRLSGRDARLEGRVRISVTDAMATPILQSLAAFRATHPRVQIDLLVTNQRLDLGRGEADLAIRMSRPREPQVIARRVKGHALKLALYASAAYLKRRPTVRPGRLDGHDVLFFAPEIRLAREPGVLAAVKGGQVVMRTNSLLSLTHAAAADLGVAVLPCFVGDAESRLVRIGRLPLTGEAWLVMHRDLRDNARVRAVFDFLAGVLDRLELIDEERGR
jgi:DNA-binding transcriptional LysR family regulator